MTKIGIAVTKKILDHPVYKELVSNHFDYWIPANIGMYTPDSDGPIVSFLGQKPIYAHALLAPLGAYSMSSVQHIKRDFSEKGLDFFVERCSHVVAALPKPEQAEIIGLTVVNEAWSYAGMKRAGDWMKVSNDYIYDALLMAHEARPDIPLYICDNNVLSDRKWDVIADELRDLLDRGAPIHGVNLQVQFHLQPKPTGVMLRSRIDQIQRMGLDVMLGECTVFVQGVPGEPLRKPIGSLETLLDDQYDVYQMIVDIGKQAGVSAIGFWSLSDEPGYGKWHWINNAEDFPGLFSVNGGLKPASKVLGIGGQFGSN